jgi:hypothetical protein
MIQTYINRLAVAVPEHEVHGTFVHVAANLLRDRRGRKAGAGQARLEMSTMSQ